jgi:Bcr/CflA subfamily drug resistance transporter
MKNKIKSLIIIAFVASLSQFGADIYTPAIPHMAKALGSDIDLIQMSLAIYLCGVAASLLIYGALSEGLGRTIPLLAGLVIMGIGSTICMLSENASTLILGRLIQGFGAGAPAGLWRAIFCDLFKGKEMAKWASYLDIFWSFIIPAAPIVGAGLLASLGWQAIFSFMILYCLGAYITMRWYFTETNEHRHPSRLKPKFIYQNYKKCLSNKNYFSITVSVFFTYGGFFSWFIISPALLIKHLEMTPGMYSLVSFLIACLGYVIGTWINSKKVITWGMPAMLRIGWAVMALSGLILWISTWMLGEQIIPILTAAFVFFLGSTLVWPSAAVTAIEPFQNIAGYAGSMYSFMQLAGGGIIGSLLAHAPDTSAMILAACFGLSGITAWLIYECFCSAHKKIIPKPEHQLPY